MSSQEEINKETTSGSNSKDAMFEPKPKPKMIRVLTVLAYVLSVSMAAILLSIYYIFMWDGRPQIGARRSTEYSSKYLELHNTSYMVQMFPKHTSVTNDIIHDGINASNMKKIKINYQPPLTSALMMVNETSQDYLKNNTAITQESVIALIGLNETEVEFSVALKLIEKAFLFVKQKMSYKSTNGIKLTKCDSQQWKTSSVIDTSVKLAGEEAKDRLYEPKHKKKLVRVLTVVAYVFFVSLAAIMLSLYYVFLWNGDQKAAAKYVVSQSRQQRQYLSNKCDIILAELQQQITALEVEALTTSTLPTTTEESITFSDDYEVLDELKKSSTFIKKIMKNKYYEVY